MAIDRVQGKAVFRLGSEEYVVLQRREYDRLAGLAKLAEAPALPAPGADGSFPAAAYARASIARTIVRERTRSGLTQKALAHLAGVRVETLCRIEKGRNTPSTATVAKIEEALRRARVKGAGLKRSAT